MHSYRTIKPGFLLGVLIGCFLSFFICVWIEDIDYLSKIKCTTSSHSTMVNFSSVLNSSLLHSSVPLRRAFRNTKLDRRPARKPPHEIGTGNCASDTIRDESIAEGMLSASSIVHEEHNGDILLGDCFCPLKDQPANWTFDCADYDWRILR